MRKELEQKLFEKYPRIFRQKDLSMKDTCMCWGIECGDGWYGLIDNLCWFIQSRIEYTDQQVEAVQVKQKFGGLRFYIEWRSKTKDELKENRKEVTDDGRTRIHNEIDGAIWFAENLAQEICEVCGKPGTPTKGGWITILCEEHHRGGFIVGLKKLVENIGKLAKDVQEILESEEGQQAVEEAEKAINSASKAIKGLKKKKKKGKK